MCLLAIAWHSHPRWRLLLAGNRDEFHDRPTAPLAAWTDPAGVLAGRDLRSGGTWAGVDDSGRMAVVTNVRNPRIAMSGAPSRGALVADFLATDVAASHRAQGLLADAGRYAPFNLLLADARDCLFIGNTPQARCVALSPGVHALSNGDLDEPWPKTRRLQQRLLDWLASGEEDVAPLWQALSDRTPAPDDALPDTGVGIDLERMLSPAFIAGTRYGTRASTLIAIDHAGHGWIAERRFGPEGVDEGESILPIG